MKTTLKDWPKVYRKLRPLGLKSESERIQFARSLAATPDERMEMNVNCLKALGFWGGVRSRMSLEKRKAKLRALHTCSLWGLQLSNEEVVRGKIFGATSKIIAQCKS